MCTRTTLPWLCVVTLACIVFTHNRVRVLDYYFIHKGTSVFHNETQLAGINNVLLSILSPAIPNTNGSSMDQSVKRNGIMGFTDYLQNHTKLALTKAPPSSTRRLKTILFWTEFRGFPDFGFGFGNKPFRDAGCKVSNCTTTHQRHLKQADAIIFHVAEPLKYQDLPRTRWPNQTFVFFVRESPIHSHLKGGLNGFFNISMTYASDADVKLYYGIIEKRDKDHPYIPYTEEIVKTKEKSKLAIALISNCNSQSQRLRVVHALQAHMYVDVFGKCSGKNLAQHCSDKYNKTCISSLISQYKFYLAFENSLCKDYITEKFYKVLDLPVIPVVYGGGKYQDVLPKGSYIDIREYESAKELAKYIQQVADDPEKFLSFFKWRENLRQTGETQLIRTRYGRNDFLKTEPRAFCDLCEFLHREEGKSRTIGDVEKLWGIKKNCLGPGTWLDTFTKM